MNSKRLIQSATAALVFSVLALCLASESFIPRTETFVGSAFRQALAVIQNSGTQWMVYLCAGVYFVSFVLLRSRRAAGHASKANFANAWLAGLLLIAAFVYASNYSISAQSTQALVLLAGAAVGQGVMVWSEWQGGHPHSSARRLVIFFLVLLLFAASLWWGNYATEGYLYHGHTRWTGPWDNPNNYGLLMGTGVVLALGWGVGRWQMQTEKSERGDENWKSGVGKYVVVMLCFLAATLMGRGLLHSFSRGAWLGVSLALLYLMSQAVKFSNFQDLPVCRWLKKNCVPLATVLLAVAILIVWQFRYSEHAVTRRALSVANTNDFSWRNRIAAWGGTLQIMAEHPWFGVGWNRLEPLYEHYFLPSKLDESVVIQRNDYLILGSSLGIPALFCFIAYLWLGLARSRFGVPPSNGPTPKLCEPETSNEGRGQTPGSTFGLFPADFLSVVGRAGAIVLLVGFWFDCGLFHLPIASVFWVLLELGAAEPSGTPLRRDPQNVFA